MNSRSACAAAAAWRPPASHFYRVEVEQLVLDQRAIERQAGLEMVVGHAALAAALGPDEDLAVSVNKRRGLLCADCGLQFPAAVVLEAAASGDAEASRHG